MLVQRFERVDGRYELGPATALGRTPLVDAVVPPGLLVLSFESSPHPTVRAAVQLDPGERLDLAVPLPAPSAIPEGFVYIPAGRFLFGSADNDDFRRSFLKAVPLHAVQTGAFLIARHEVTYREWLVYLRAIPPAARRQRTPVAVNPPVLVQLRRQGDGRYELTLGRQEAPYRVLEGQRLSYRDRDRRARPDWLNLPVSGLSLEDAEAYVSWLDRTGRVPGARLCDEREWERAARGADGRRFPHGDRAEPDDFNHDMTYGLALRAFGPDEVGSHPASRSPFGVDDLAGNVWELVHDTKGGPLIRGGSWFHGLPTNQSNNREEGQMRGARIGVRVCASIADSRVSN